MAISAREVLRLGSSVEGLEGRFQQAGLKAVPRSLRTLLDFFGRSTLVFNQDMNLNDVSTFSKLTIHSDGKYLWEGTASDDGFILGDVYSLAVSLTRASPDNFTFALSHQGDMGAGKSDHWTQSGTSAWLRDHWDLALTSQARWRLSQRAEIGTLINLIFGLGIVQPAPTSPSTGGFGG